MIDDLALITTISSLAAALAGAGASTEIARRLFRRTVPDVASLTEDLADSRVDRWNEFRAQHKDVVPSLKNLDLSNRDLSGADFSGCDLEGADFPFSDLQRSDFRHAKLDGANFVGADISLSSFEGASLKNAKLEFDFEQSGEAIDRDLASQLDELVRPRSNDRLRQLIKGLPGEEPLRVQSTYISEFISNLHGFEFEEFVAELMSEFGFKREDLRDRASDFPDLYVSKDDPFFTVSLLVEMKTFRGEKKVGTEAIHQVIRYLNAFSSRATGAIIVTNTGFSAAAQTLADESPLLSLVDNRSLTFAVDQMLVRHTRRLK